MTSEAQTAPEMLCLKYRGILTPWEITQQGKRIGFKCKKYANWKDVHVGPDSKTVLREVGDALIDDGDFDLAHFGHLCRIWERVQRWTKDKETFSLEPDLCPRYENLRRLVIQGAREPGIVDVVLTERGFSLQDIAEDDRWLLFLSVCAHQYFQRNKRFTPAIREGVEAGSELRQHLTFIDTVDAAATLLYDEFGFTLQAGERGSAVMLLVEELGLPIAPEKTARENSTVPRARPRTWVEDTEQPGARIARLKYSEGAMIVQINRLHPAFRSGPMTASLNCSELWSSLGMALLDHLGDLDNLQDFFDTWGIYLRNSAR